MNHEGNGQALELVHRDMNGRPRFRRGPPRQVADCEWFWRYRFHSSVGPLLLLWAEP